MARLKKDKWLMNPEDYEITLQVIVVLDELNVPYVIVGSLASTFHGMARTTLDSDLVADLQLEHVEEFVQPLQDSFYVDATAVRNAIMQKRSFNLIHFETAFKVDIFIPRDRPFDQLQLRNRQEQLVMQNPPRTAYILSAEDTILAKLDWYRQGGEISERQWRDVQAVVRVQGERLDWKYMMQEAKTLGIDDLLKKLK